MVNGDYVKAVKENADREAVKAALRSVVQMKKQLRDEEEPEAASDWERVEQFPASGDAPWTWVWLAVCALCIFWFLVGLLVGKAWGGECEVDQTTAVIHHTASPDVDVATVDRWHKERGWDGIGYHFLFRANGAVEVGRPACTKGAHTKGRNNYLGLVLTGYDNFTSKQVSALRGFLRARKIQHIQNHHSMCPGIGIDLRKIAKELKIEYTEFK